MARGVNKVILIGHLGREPETKYTQDGMAICNLSLATTSSHKDREGTLHEQTQWHRVKFFGKLAEIARDYLHKGSRIYLEGEIRYGKYTDQSGIEKYTTDIYAKQLNLLGSGQDQPSHTPNARPASARANRSPRQTAQAQPANSSAQPFEDQFQDDEIPF